MGILEMAAAWNINKYQTCLHEAGHAVMCLYLGVSFQSIEILSHDQGRLSSLPRGLDKLDRAKIYIAGPVAESIYLGKDISTSVSSVDDAIELMHMNVNDTFLKPAVKSILEKNWHKVEAIAQLLMKENKVFYSQIKDL